MRIEWRNAALNDLERIAERAPRQAARVLEVIEALAASPFPGMFRHDPRHADQRILTVAWTPYLVIYRLRPEGGTLRVVRLLDGRRQRTPL